MSRKTVILLTKEGEKPETYASIKALCSANPSFKYSYVKGLRLPFKYKGWNVEKQSIS